MAWTGNKKTFCALEFANIAKFDICRVTKGRNIVHLYGRMETRSVSSYVDMLPRRVEISYTCKIGQNLGVSPSVDMLPRRVEISYTCKVGQNLGVSPSVNMLLFGVTIPVTVPQRSEIPGGLMNYPVYQ
jgi:hypothetical protein